MHDEVVARVPGGVFPDHTGTRRPWTSSRNPGTAPPHPRDGAVEPALGSLHVRRRGVVLPPAAAANRTARGCRLARGVTPPDERFRPHAERRAEVAANLTAVEARVQAACDAVGRQRSGIVVVAVTKSFPDSDIRLLHDLGVSDIGESRDQEAAPKAAACADLPLTWHFVGRLQTNKVRSVSSYAQVVHSVDRTRLVSALTAGAAAAGRNFDVFVQVSLDGDPARGGVLEAHLARLVEAVSRAPGLRLRGLMAIAPLGEEPAAAFGRLAELAERTRADHPDARWLSAGMSGDLEAAIAAGATHVRVGTGILGSRPVLG